MNTALPSLRTAPAPLIAAGNAVLLGAHPSTDADLRRVRPGIYTARRAWEDLPAWDRYLLRVHAFRLVRPDAMFSHESAAALRGLPLFGHPRHLHIFDERRERSLAYGDVHVHTSVDRRRAQDADGILLTTVVDTVIDLARALPPAFGLAVADAAVRTSGLTGIDLRAVLERQRNPRGRRRAEWVLSRTTPLAESVGESLSRAVIEWCGFPSPELQREHHVEGRRYRSDFCWPEHRVIGESDGWMKYGGGGDPAASAVAIREEKRREDALRRAGWRIARWDYAGAITVPASATPLPGPASLRRARRTPRTSSRSHAIRAPPDPRRAPPTKTQR